MFSIKYLSVSNAKIKRLETPHNPYALSYHCPECDRSTGDSGTRLLEENGGMAKYLVYRCRCGTTYKYVD